MKLKSVILGSLFIIISCVLSNNDKNSQYSLENDDEPKCYYRYFLNNKNELDSNIIECDDPKPPKPKTLHPLNIDSVKIYNIG